MLESNFSKNLTLYEENKTLLKLLKNREECETGNVWIAPNLKISFLEQDPTEPRVINLLEFLTELSQYFSPYKFD